MVSGERSRKHAFPFALRRYRTQLILAIFLALTGFATTTQVLSHKDDPLSTSSVDDLSRLYEGLGSAAQRARVEIERLEEGNETVRQQTAAEEQSLATQQQAIEDLSIFAGEVPVQGPGIRLRITNPPSGVLAQDLVLSLLSELRVAGAEAMDLNGVRLIHSTPIATAEAGLLLGPQKLTAPYRLTVIGSPSSLQGAVNFPDGSIRQLLDLGSDVTARSDTDLQILSTVDAQAPRIASPFLDEQF